MTDDLIEFVGRNPVIVAVAAAILLLAIRRKHVKRTSYRSRDPLDVVLMWWDRLSPLTVRGLLMSILTLGRTGSGKTTSSDKQITRAVLNYPAAGGLWLLSKPQDLRELRQRLAEAGRSDDLLVFGPRHGLTFGFLDWILKNGGTPRDAASFITLMGESLKGGKGGGENSDFFEGQVFRVFENAAALIFLATACISAPDIQRFIYTAATSPAELASDTWREGSYCNQILRAASVAPKSPVAEHDFAMQRDFWCIEWVRLAEKTRSCILTSALGILHVFNSGDVRTLVSTTTNVSPADMLRGKFVAVDASPSEYGDAGTFLATGWKYLTQRFVLSRTYRPGDPIVVIHADEAHLFVNPFDATYLAQCRSFGGCMIYVSQSVASFNSAFTAERGKDQALALLANFGHRVFHALGSPEDAEYASALLGKYREVSFGGSMAPSEDAYDSLFGQSKFSGSFNESWQNRLQPAVFYSLRCGGPNDFLADSIIVRSGEPFESTGQNYLFATFSQR